MFHLIEVAKAGVITDAPTFQDIGSNVLNFLLSIVGIIAIIALVVSGIMYLISFGDERRMEIAKKSVKYSIIGIVIALGAMVLVKMVGQFFQ
jgi:hypothetical protein